MSTPTINLVGQIERKTQQRVVKLFCDTLGYDYLGDWVDRIGNRNIEPDLLTAWLRKCGVDEALITRALHFLDKAAGDTSKSLYDRNRDVYNLLRYAVFVTGALLKLFNGARVPRGMLTASATCWTVSRPSRGRP